MAEEKFIPNASVGSSKEAAFKKPETTRRSFLSWLSLGWVAYIGVTGGFFTMIVRFLFPNVLFEPPQTFKIGFPDDFSKNSVDIIITTTVAIENTRYIPRRFGMIKMFVHEVLRRLRTNQTLRKPVTPNCEYKSNRTVCPVSIGRPHSMLKQGL